MKIYYVRIISYNVILFWSNSIPQTFPDSNYYATNIYNSVYFTCFLQLDYVYFAIMVKNRVYLMLAQWYTACLPLLPVFCFILQQACDISRSVIKWATVCRQHRHLVTFTNKSNKYTSYSNSHVNFKRVH